MPPNPQQAYQMGTRQHPINFFQSPESLMEEIEREFFGDSLFGPSHPFGGGGGRMGMMGGPGFSFMHQNHDPFFS